MESVRSQSQSTPQALNEEDGWENVRSQSQPTPQASHRAESDHEDDGMVVHLYICYTNGLLKIFVISVFEQCHL